MHAELLLHLTRLAGVGRYHTGQEHHIGVVAGSQAAPNGFVSGRFRGRGDGDDGTGGGMSGGIGGGIGEGDGEGGGEGDGDGDGGGEGDGGGGEGGGIGDCGACTANKTRRCSSCRLQG